MMEVTDQCNNNPETKTSTFFRKVLDTAPNIYTKLNIRITCPYDVYHLIPHFYIVKLGFKGVCIFFLVLIQNIDCGYSLEPSC